MNGPRDILRTALMAHLDPVPQPDLQTRAQPFGLILVSFPDGRVRVGSPGRYITFANSEAASAALDLLDLVAHLPRTDALPTGTTEKTYLTPNSVKS